jgi:hypothetical protein
MRAKTMEEAILILVGRQEGKTTKGAVLMRVHYRRPLTCSTQSLFRAAPFDAEKSGMGADALLVVRGGGNCCCRKSPHGQVGDCSLLES